MQLVIIAGGKGTRLKERTADLPKPMVQIAGKPLLEHQILLARKYGITDIVVLTGYGAPHIEDYFADGSRWGVKIRYSREPEPLGTAGAVFHASQMLQGRFLVMYGDTMLNVDLSRLIAAHPANAAATLFVHPNDHPQDSDLVEIDESNRILNFHPYPHPPDASFRNLVNAALYVVEKSAVEFLPQLTSQAHVDFAKHLFPALVAAGETLHAYVSREYIKDVGTPDRLDRIEADFANGRIPNGSFETAVPAIFLDRDGTLNYERGFISSPEEMELFPFAAEAVRLINRSGRLAVIITNQPVVARGECTEDDLRRIHNRFEWLLGKESAYVDAIYYCPHHPHGGFSGERPELKKECLCRKPGLSLFNKAVADMNIDLERSWMIGDRPGDIEAAKSLGVHSAWVQTGYQGLLANPFNSEYQFLDVLEAAKFIGTQLRA